MTDFNSFLEASPYVAGTAALAGGGARALKGIYDMVTRQDPEAAPVSVAHTELPLAHVPVPVSNDEAEELRRKGIKVRRVLKTAFEMPSFNVNPAEALGLGALGTGAGIAGWKFTNWLMNRSRQGAVTEEKERVKNRIRNLLNDTPDENDETLHAHMKAAEDVYFMKKSQSKNAGVWNSVPGSDAVNTLAALVGGSLVFSGMRAYNQARAGSESSAKIQGLKNLLRKKKTEPPMAIAEPVEYVDSQPAPVQPMAA